LHGLAEVADLFFLLAFAFAAQHACAFAQQAAEGVGGFGQRGVVGAVHEVLRDDAALDVAVVAAADAQDGLVGAHVEFAGHFGRHVPVVLSSRSLSCSATALASASATVSRLMRHAVGMARNASASMKLREAGDHRLGHLVLARQLGQGVAGEQGGAGGATREHAGVHQRDAQQVAVERRWASLQVQLFLAGLDLVQRRLRDVDVAALHQLGHLAVEEGQQQGADVRAVHVGVGHDDDAVVAQLGDVEVVVCRWCRRPCRCRCPAR
jgi:hypothetical protein